MCFSYGGKLDDYPHPEANMSAFEAFISEKNNATPSTWDTVSKRDRTWIDIRAVHAQYAGGSCCIIS